jgi:hypothetical protein
MYGFLLDVGLTALVLTALVISCLSLLDARPPRGRK